MGRKTTSLAPAVVAALLAVALCAVVVHAQTITTNIYQVGPTTGGQQILEIYWNATGFYIRVYPFEQLRLGKFIFNVYYDFSNHSFYSKTVSLDLGDYVYVNSTGIYIQKGVYTNKTVIEVAPRTCLYIEEAKEWLCGYENGSTYDTNLYGNFTFDVHVNSCVVVVYSYMTYVNETPPKLHVEIYDFYWQTELWSGDLENVTYFVLCGVPDKLLINVTLVTTNEWLGMFYISTVMPRVSLPSNLAPFGFVLLLGIFLAFGVRHKTRLAGLGMMIYGFLLPAIVGAFGLATTPWAWAMTGVASCLLIVIGILLLLFANKM